MITQINHKKLITGGSILLTGILLFTLARTDYFSASAAPETPVSSEQNLLVVSVAPTAQTALAPAATGKPAASAGCVLSLTFTVGSGDLYSPGATQYALVAKNIGTKTCDQASISIYYGDNESFVDAAPKPTSNGYYWRIGALEPGKTYAITLKTERDAITDRSNTNQACLSADNGTDACRNASMMGVGSSATHAAGPTSLSSGGKEMGIWVWTPLSELSADQMKTIIRQASENHFNAIYITIDDYLAIQSLPAGPTKDQKLQQFKQSVTMFITFANQKNISVDAEAGWRDWGEPEQRWKAHAILTFVSEYNRSHSTKFRGLQYDIEPYLLPQYQKNKKEVLSNYVQLAQELVKQSKEVSLPLTFVVPHFYDAAQQWTPEVSLDTTSDYALNHLVKLLHTAPGSRIIIMAYRNFASDSDGAIDLSKEEVRYANKHNVKVIVAQETGPVEPDYTTFHGLPKRELFAQVETIQRAFASDPAFDGIAVDYLDTFLKLPQ